MEGLADDGSGAGGSPEPQQRSAPPESHEEDENVAQSENDGEDGNSEGGETEGLQGPHVRVRTGGRASGTRNQTYKVKTGLIKAYVTVAKARGRVPGPPDLGDILAELSRLDVRDEFGPTVNFRIIMTELRKIPQRVEAARKAREKVLSGKRAAAGVYVKAEWHKYLDAAERVVRAILDSGRSDHARTPFPTDEVASFAEVAWIPEVFISRASGVERALTGVQDPACTQIPPLGGDPDHYAPPDSFLSEHIRGGDELGEAGLHLRTSCASDALGHQPAYRRHVSTTAPGGGLQWKVYSCLPAA